MRLPIEVFAIEMRGMAAVFQTEVTEVMSEIYYRRFSGWSEEQFKGACSRCLAEMTFFPKPNEISARFPAHVPTSYDAPAPERMKLGADTAVPNQAQSGADTLERVIDKMTDQEIIDLLIADSFNVETARQILAVFKREPNGNVRGYLKDLICPDWDLNDQPRFYCPDCRDRGAVEIYAAEDIETAIKYGKTSIGEVPTRMCACSCKRAEKFLRPIQPEEFNRCAPLRGIEPTDRRADSCANSAPISAPVSAPIPDTPENPEITGENA